MNVTPTPELFHSAAQVLRERGLARGVTEDDDGQVCLLGTCGVAATGDAANGVWLFDVTQVMAQTLNWGREHTAFWIVTRFNDDRLADAEDGARFLERVGAGLT